MAFFILPNVGKAVFRRFFVFPMLGKSIFADFLFSQCWESQFSMIFDFPSRGINLFSPIFTCRTPTKASFCRFSFIVPLRKHLFLIFVHRTPTKASFSRFSFIVPLRKPPFAVFRSSYPYESLLLPFFINCTPYLSDFSRKSMIYARI